MKKCVFAGTFDPFTVGHEDTVNKCLALFDEVIVAVALSMCLNPTTNTKETSRAHISIW